MDEVIVARLDSGDDVLLSIQRAAKEHAVTAGVFSLIGAVDRAKCGYYNPKTRAYDARTWNPHRWGSKLLEILACVGNVGQLDGDPIVHGHISLMSYGTFALGGHLLEGCRINPTGELTLLKARGTLTRRLDKTLNLALLSL
jgi:predicted DNA-binding protein with PD1-like motif